MSDLSGRISSKYLFTFLPNSVFTFLPKLFADLSPNIKAVNPATSCTVSVSFGVSSNPFAILPANVVAPCEEK